MQEPGQATAVGGATGGRGLILGQQFTPEDVLRGARAARDELLEVLDQLEDRRENLVEELQQAPSEANRRGLEQRLADIDARISQTEVQLAQADAEVVRAAAQPGAVPPPPPHTEEPPPVHNLANPPEEYILLGGLFIVLVFFPIAIGYARRLWKRGAQTVAAIPAGLVERFGQLEQTVESIAIEVERIGEGQRFMTRVFARHAAPGDKLPASLTDELELPRAK